MKFYDVQITNKALSDLEEIYNYIANVLMAPETAKSTYIRITDSIERLNFFPERCPIMDSDEERKRKIRHLQVENYAVFYVVRDDIVTVIRVLHSSFDIGSRLFIG